MLVLRKTMTQQLKRNIFRISTSKESLILFHVSCQHVSLKLWRRFYNQCVSSFSFFWCFFFFLLLLSDQKCSKAANKCPSVCKLLCLQCFHSYLLTITFSPPLVLICQAASLSQMNPSRRHGCPKPSEPHLPTHKQHTPTPTYPGPL